MSENYHSPAPQESLHLHNSRAIIDVHKDIVPPGELNLPREDESYQFSIVGEMNLGDESSGNTLSLIRTINKKSGMAELFVVGVAKDQQGNKSIAGEWESIPVETPLVIGRNPAKEGENYKISGKKLFGVEFPMDVSRKHLTVELSSDGQLSIEDTSKGGSQIKGNAYEKSNSSNLIDKVPTAEDLAQQRANEQAAILAEKERQIAEVQARLDSITSRLSEKDSDALWKYRSGLANKREAQQRGDGQESYRSEMMASDGLNEMSASAKEVREEYRALADRLAELRGY